jgi:SAM-dependent methyltransferase
MRNAFLHPRAGGAGDATAARTIRADLPPRAPAAEADARHEFALDVARDLALQPKRLQPKYLYDALGSRLFEAICELPWYRITRAERRLLELHAGAMTDSIADLTAIIELGCGSGEKLALLAAGMRRRARPLRVHLVDISPASACARLRRRRSATARPSSSSSARTSATSIPSKRTRSSGRCAARSVPATGCSSARIS